MAQLAFRVRPDSHFQDQQETVYRPYRVLGDRAYDAESVCCALRSRQIVPRLAMRNTKHGSGLGRRRWVVERSFAGQSASPLTSLTFHSHSSFSASFEAVSDARGAAPGCD